MKILIDTNVVLDHFLSRSPFGKAAERIFSETEQGRLTTYVGATTITTIHYLLTRSLNNKAAQRAIEQLLQLFEVAAVNRLVLASALLLKFPDFEDAVLHEAAVHAGVQAIITRDSKGFKKSKLTVYSPNEFIASLVKA